jgi:phosphonate transport system substrate-binding protein
VALVSSCSGEAAAGGAPGLLRFTAIPGEDTTELAAKFEPLAAHLSRELGVDFEYLPTQGYAASVSLFEAGDVQLAWFGGLTGVQARAAVPGSHAIAQGRVDPDYKSYFIAHASLGLDRGDDFPRALAGKRFTFGSDSSTSGRLMPEYFIRQASGQSPEEFFGAPNHFSGGHDKTAALVQAGTFECGAIDYKTYDRGVKDGTIDPEVCRVVWVTPTYPDYNWTVRPELDATHGAGFTERLRQVLLDLRDPELLAAVNRPEGLIRAENSDFERIRELALELGFLR